MRSSDRSGQTLELPPYARLAVAALVQRGRSGDSQWLLLHRTDPVDAWDPPGGRMEAGEDLLAAVVREAREETGLSARVAGPCYAYLTVYKGERLLVVSMACRIEGDAVEMRLEPDGADAWRWASPDEWQKLAATGRSTWNTRDVGRATRLAALLWEMEDE